VTPEFNLWSQGPTVQPWLLQRAGELNAQRGHRREAIERYSQLVELWKNADPDLQPLVRDVRGRIAKLTAQGG
jgi:hypothetical protein